MTHSLKISYNRKDVLHGLLIYSIGDAIATLLVGRFMLLRLLGMMLVGAVVYAWEVPAYFRWIDRRTSSLPKGLGLAAARTGLALLYFNPLWIARHLLFIAVFSSDWTSVDVLLLRTALISWLVNIPLSIIGNAVIQVGLPLKWRFFGSATFSGLMAVYYALSGVWFNGR